MKMLTRMDTGKMIPRLLSLLCALMLLIPSALSQSADGDKLYETSLALLSHIEKGEEEAALALMDETMVKALTGKLAGMWQQLEAAGGAFEGTGAHRQLQEGGYDIVLLELRFKNLGLVQRAVFDASGRVAGLFFAPGALPDEKNRKPEGQMQSEGTETPLTVDAGEGYPLEGLLTLPEGEVKAAAVLVQGSGPSDRDESIGANAPFHDLAQGLARLGIATLRYDKRTYVYGAKMVEELGAESITAREETVNDAAAALRLLRERPETAGKPVYLIGHSLGAMLASYIGSVGGAPDGYVLLAGSPRKLWQLSEAQNILIYSELAAGCRKLEADQAREMIAMEQKKAWHLEDLSAETKTVFGLPLAYLQQLEGVDAAALHLDDKKPVLVLQGEKDRQVGMEDFALWKEKLAEHPAAKFISYPGLNHLFGRYEGEEIPFSRLMEEYAARTPVDRQVIDDIAAFMLAAR